jgi:hypothetical protein
LAGPGELARCRGAGGRGGLRGGQRGGDNVAPGRKYTGRTGDEEEPT